MKGWGLGLALALSAAAALGAAGESGLQVTGAEGRLRSWRYEIEPWPLEGGMQLGDGARVELEAGARLRLRYAHDVDLVAAGPASLAVYVVDLPQGESSAHRTLLRLEAGSLLVDGRFQFGRPADLVLGLPDQSLAVPPDARFFAVAGAGAGRLYLPVSAAAGSVAASLALPAALSGAALVAQPGAAALLPPGLDVGLFTELTRTVKLFVIARDYDQDLGTWPRPAVLGPLLAERMARVPGLQVVDGSGSTSFAYAANGALKSGDDDYLKELGRRQGARWVMAGNCVSLTPPQEEAPSRRGVLGEAEVRLLEVEAGRGGLELVTEAAVTRVARAGRALELASRQAQEAAADEVAGYLDWHLRNLLAGQAHGAVLMKLVLEGATPDAVRALRGRLSGLDAVSRFFRRGFAQKTAAFDLLLRKDAAELDRQWAAAPAVPGWRFKPLPSDDNERRFRAVPAP